MLITIVVIPIIGVMMIKRKRVGIITAGMNFIMSIGIWLKYDNNETNYQMVISGVVGVDGISIVFIILTTFITIQIMNQAQSIRTSVIILILSSLIIVTFISLDILIWYISFELILIPMFIMIISQEKIDRKIKYAAYKLYIYTLIGSLMMLIGIIIIDYTTRNNELYVFI